MLGGVEGIMLPQHTETNVQNRKQLDLGIFTQRLDLDLDLRNFPKLREFASVSVIEIFPIYR